MDDDGYFGWGGGVVQTNKQTNTTSLFSCTFSTRRMSSGDDQGGKWKAGWLVVDDLMGGKTPPKRQDYTHNLLKRSLVTQLRVI